MEFITLQTEQTTAITDIFLGVAALWSIFYLKRFSKVDNLKVILWKTVFSFLSAAAFLGALRHGIVQSAMTNNILWKAIYLTLAFMVAIFLAAAVYDMFGAKILKKFMPVSIVTALGFFLITQVTEVTFFVFILYQMIATIVALIIYLVLAWNRKSRGFFLLSIGIILNMTASAIQAGKYIVVNIGFKLDNNGIFHIIGIFALWAFTIGISESLKEKNKLR